MAVWHFIYNNVREVGPGDFRAFTPDDYLGSGLGGSESSLVLLTEGLVRRGHAVHVYTHCREERFFAGVRWAPVQAVSCSARPDVLVFVRNRASVLTQLEAPATLFWMLDDQTDGAALFYDAFHDRGGKVVVASLAFEYLLREAGVAAETVMIQHPIQLGSYPDDSVRSLACLYCSVPNRGLDVALVLWPQIVARVPEAQLWVTSGYQLWGWTDAEAADGLRVALRGVPVPVNTTFWGPVPKETLWRLQASASLLFYPCRFRELFCISAAECAAAGLPVVTSRIGALSERVVHGRTGILIDGDIADPSTQRTFVDSTVALLLDDSLRVAMGRRGQVLAAECGVERVVSHWESLFDRRESAGHGHQDYSAED